MFHSLIPYRIPFRVILVGIVFLSAMIMACAPGQQRSATGSEALQDVECGPFPVRFQDVVMAHVFETYPGDMVLRNVVVSPPSVGLLPMNAENVPGYVGRVRFSLKSEERQAYLPVTYCYFLREDRVLAFENAQDAEWCGILK
ncbi:hypothetical protein SAMN05660653_03077 [Desulfonatronum thiosulfatophilum]|uniref:Uncharacterized protein n=1 Tax=Desulfonatronum thiosulfatophilum TaxID=617002 RepID=A0A1G6ERG9_9BACT|nr:hypothetical protein [Desulfonatronum thiosulfatophilum]SDB60011.1 hypothetical protein SAMN05660653_03077 [Desulfonatronum thiosulfatophilum]